MQRSIILLLFICHLAIFLSNVEAKPHLTNFFMGNDFDKKRLSSWGKNQEMIDAERDPEPVTDGKSESYFTLQDFPRGKCKFLKKNPGLLLLPVTVISLPNNHLEPF